MTYRGHVKNGVVVLDPAVALPEGAEVDVSPVSPAEAIPTVAERYKDIIGILDGLPPDASVNHDFYLYGAPKQ